MFNNIFGFFTVIILVIGAAGFIGFHLAQRLYARGDEVVGLDNGNDYYDIRVKYGRLQKAGIEKREITYNVLLDSSRSRNYRFIRLNLEDKEEMMSLFERGASTQSTTLQRMRECDTR